MKNKFLSFFAVLSCCIFIVSPVGAFSAGEDVVLDIITQTIFSEFLRSSSYQGTPSEDSGFTGFFKDSVNKALDFMSLNPVFVDDGLTFTMPKYQIITGKYQLQQAFDKYDKDTNTITETVLNDTLFECTAVFFDADGLCGVPVGTDRSSGRTLFSNALNLTVYYQSGAVDRLVCVFDKNMYSHVHISGGNLSIDSGTLYHYDVYWYTGDTLSTLLYPDVVVPDITFTKSVNNNISRSLSDICPPNPTSANPLALVPSGYSTQYSGDPPMHNELLIQEYVNSERFYVLYYRLNRGNSSTIYANRQFNALSWFYVGFYTTNDPDKENTLNIQFDEPSEQNYYFDNKFIGGTTINNTNYNEFGGGGLAPVFTLPDVDFPNLPLDELLDLLTSLLPDIEAGFNPSLDVNLDSLFDRLFDFFGVMPDIGLPWGDNDDNDYWLDLPDVQLPDSGGGGSGSVWFPPEYDPVNTSVYIPAVVPSYSTYVAATAPAQVLTGGKNVFSMGYGVLDTLGIWSLVVPLAIVGIFWRFTGGD